jgi:hypothetical protein
MGELSARVNLVRLLATQGRIDELQELADSGDQDAARHLLEVLTSQNDVTGLQAEVDAGTEDAPQQLTATLAAKGTTGRYDARHISSFGFNADGSVFDPADLNPHH